MPPAPSEPEKYSIDEMMERLKGQTSDTPAGAGELVTRADGTQAVRVRKRKRRSDQPRRDEAKRLKRSRVLQVATALVVLLLAGLAVGAAFVYANTTPYRKSIADAIANSTGASVEFKLFRVSPVSANADSIELEWPAGHALKSIHLTGVAAKISPFSVLGTALRGDEIAAREGRLLLQAPAANAAPPALPESGAKTPVQFNRIAVPKFNVIVGDPTRPALRIVSTEAALRLDKPNHQTALHLYRGNLQIDGWPTYKIDRAVMEFHGAETELVVLRISDSHPKRGILSLAGTLRPFATDARSTLSVKLDNFDLGELLGAEFTDLISAKIDTQPDVASNTLSFLPGSLASTDLNLAFKNTLSSKVTIKGFPFLLSLVRRLSDTWYEAPIFLGDSSGIIHRKGNLIELRDLRLESKSRMAIHANLTVAADKSLSGTMEVGIPESAVEPFPNTKILAMLTPPRDGYCWFTLKIGGTLAHPSDNFATLYAAAREDTTDPDAAPPDAAAPATDPHQKAFDDLTRPQGP